MTNELFSERQIPLASISLVEGVSEPFPAEPPNFAFMHLVRDHMNSHEWSDDECERQAAPYLGFPVLVAEQMAPPFADDEDPSWMRGMYGEGYVLLAGRPIHEAYTRQGSHLNTVRAQVVNDNKRDSSSGWMLSHRAYFNMLIDVWCALKRNHVPAMLHEQALADREIRHDVDALRYVSRSILRTCQSASARDKEHAAIVSRLSRKLRCPKTQVRELMLGSGI